MPDVTSPKRTSPKLVFSMTDPIKVPIEIEDVPEADLTAFDKLYLLLNKDAVDPATGCWKDGCRVAKAIRLRVNNISVWLNPDGTYSLSDDCG